MVSEGLRVTRYLTGFARQLLASGLRHAVVCPGSRSTPLAVVLADTPGIQIWVHVDERAAAYFGLGLAKASDQPVVLVATSGTAAANFLPAVAEAKLGRVPLIVLTADRPRELREIGAAQTMPQVNLYGPHVKWFMDMPSPSTDPAVVRYAAVTAARAADLATSAPQGPVHLNFPFREPLLPEADPAPPVLAPIRIPTLQAQASNLTDSDLASLVSHRHGLIVAGPGTPPGIGSALDNLSQASGWPILADPLSNLRARRETITAYDTFLRHPARSRRLQPSRVIRIGAPPTSKILTQWLADIPLALIDAPGTVRDPALQADLVLTGDCAKIIAQLAAHPDWAPDKAWAASWQTSQSIAADRLEQALRQAPASFEGQPFWQLGGLLHSAGELPVLVASSMPVRDLDSFGVRPGGSLTFYANRGANGIDGLLSTGLGLAAVRGRAVIIVGDLAFYHDMNGLMAAHRYALNALVLVINNGGGGIFSFLPQAGIDGHRFEQLFGTPHRLDFSGATTLYGGRFHRVDTIDGLKRAIDGWLQADGLDIVEWVALPRSQNVQIHRTIWETVNEGEG
ncbi:MAG: 2-succinyl-5-enolpyruvyl-6-hydroxy-3-cyclohexene-1-carboxylic-acid synthase [Thermaerobacter sp.]|nr:2-succinyl-5-enolpyruvyl-6-hydroxy-3-cyclohexene-1-carboxylic-acid synthase [Thermaerobacter sp.]